MDSTINKRLVPNCFGPLKHANGNSRVTGPCGDTMEYWLYIEDNIIQCANFTTDGCGHSIACGEATSKLSEGKTILEAKKIPPEEVLELTGNVTEESAHCAVLATTTLNEAIKDYEKKFDKVKKEECKNTENKSEKCHAYSENKSKNHHSEDDDIFKGLNDIKNKIVVLSGKGGVGKSTVAVNTAISLTLKGYKVGLLDIDIHGPSIPTMLGITEYPTIIDEKTILPVKSNGLEVMSIGLLIKKHDAAIVWRGPMKSKMIEQFLSDVIWGQLDYLIIDSPPGTGDEPLSVCQYIENINGAIIVTTPQEVSAVDVRKSISFCQQLEIPILGIIENMSGFICPDCGKVTNIFNIGGGKKIAEQYRVPFAGCIPIEPNIGEACDEGIPYIKKYANSKTAMIFNEIISSIIK